MAERRPPGAVPDLHERGRLVGVVQWAELHPILVEIRQYLKRGVKDAFEGLPAPHAATHRLITGSDPLGFGMPVPAGTGAAALGGSELVANAEHLHPVEVLAPLNNVAQWRNGTTAVSLHVYRTWTSASVFERLELGWSGTDAYVATNEAGAGVGRNLLVGTRGADAGDLKFITGDTARWTISFASPRSLIPTTDAGQDLGSLSLHVRTVHGGGGQSRASQTVSTSPFTVNENHSLLDVTASGGAITTNLPAATSVPGALFWIRKTDSTTNTVTIDADGSDTIDGAGTLVLRRQFDSVLLQARGAAWSVLASTIPQGTATQSEDDSRMLAYFLAD